MPGNQVPRPTSHTYFSQRLKLHYLDWGNPDSVPVMLVHGSQDHCRNWDWTSEILCTSYHVIAPDLRGHGDSQWASSYSSLDYVYDLHQLIEQAGLPRVHLVGHSLGGLIVTLYAGLYPEKVASLVAIEGVGSYWTTMRDEQHPQSKLREWVDQVRGLAGRVPRRYESQEAALKRMQESNPHLSEERAEHLTIHGSNRNEDGTYSWKFDPYTYAWSPSGLQFEETMQIWEKINCPTLLLNATEGMEHRTGQDDTLRHFRTAELSIIGDAGHWLHHDQFDEYINQLQAFLGRN